MNREESQIRNVIGKFFPMLIGIVLIILAYYYFQYLDHKKLADVQNWFPTQAIIKNESIDVYNDPKHGEESRITTLVAYVFKGNKYETKIQADYEFITNRLNTTQAETLLRHKYPLNDKISILFDPKQPTNVITAATFNILRNSDDEGDYILKGVGILFILVGFARLCFASDSIKNN